MNEEEDNSLTSKEKKINKKYKDREKEINEDDPLNTFEIIQFETNRPKPSSKNKLTTILLFCIAIVFIAMITLYFLNRSDRLFNEDLKMYKLKIRRYKKDNELLKEKLDKRKKRKDDVDDDEDRKKKKEKKI